MTDEDRITRIQGLIADEPSADGSEDGLVGRLTQQCRALARAVPAVATGMSIVSEGRPGTVIATSGPDAARFEELQVTLGVGPCLEAHTTRRPVLEPDLPQQGAVRWPGYSTAMAEHGIRAVFAFPMQVGAARLGVLDVYRDRSGPLSTDALNVSLAFAAVAVTTLLDSQSAPAGELGLSDDLDAALTHRSELHQAQGMVMIQLGVTLIEAMSRLRAHAFAHESSLGQVAQDIVGRKLRLDRDHD